MNIIVGLGNYGSEYTGTRHNVGSWIVDEFSKRYAPGSTWKHERPLSSYLIKVDPSCLLIKSDGFMNNSGTPVSKVCRFFKVPATQLIVVCDEITLEVGDVKLTDRPGCAGHNGVRNILDTIGPGFVRFRVGVGQKKFPGMDLADHVLGKFTPDEQALLQNNMPDICNKLKLLLDKGISSAMNVINRKICRQDRTEQP